MKKINKEFDQLETCLTTIVGTVAVIVFLLFLYVYIFYIPPNCDSLLLGRNFYQVRYNEYAERYKHLDGDNNGFICEKKMK